MKCSAGYFFVAQCAIDFGFPPSQNGSTSFVPQHILQLIGIAKSNTDLGNTFIHPETKVDKLISHFFHHDITLGQSEQFSNKYYIISDRKENVHLAFNALFLDEIAKYDDLLLATKGTEIYISYSSALAVEQGVILANVFDKYPYLSKV